MSRALLTTTLWLALGDALAAGIVYGFLITPESNVLMLVTSAVLILLAAALLAVTSASAAYGLVACVSPWRGLGPALRRLPIVFVGLIAIGVLCAGAGWFGDWWMSRSGEFDAAAIAAGDITRTGWVHATVRWLVAAIQWVIVPAWTATMLAWAAAYATRDVSSGKWLTGALRWRLLAVCAIAVVTLVWLPWRAAYWRPRGLSASSVEVVFLGAKLLVIYLLAQLAWALILWTAARATSPMPSPAVAEPKTETEVTA